MNKQLLFVFKYDDGQIDAISFDPDDQTYAIHVDNKEVIRSRNPRFILKYYIDECSMSENASAVAKTMRIDFD